LKRFAPNTTMMTILGNSGPIPQEQKHIDGNNKQEALEAAPEVNQARSPND
jgi:hypothetical protein